ncbi:MAG: GC-type dockerin domain-anchored protein [Phycisphaerae bacterium]|jgi:hypothetical protein
MNLHPSRVLPSAALFTLLACPPAMAQVAPSAPVSSGSRLVETPVTLDVIHRFHVTSLGRVLEDGPAYSPRDCNRVSTWTDANFNGGSFVVQAGFAQGEVFAATYTVPAASWPIKINLAETIFATSNSIINTTTQWSILFWQGNPATGSLVFSESADDVVLPWIRIPAGTNGVNVQFSIDPGDPDQLIIQDNGSHQFSVGWRIDRHQQQTANPCLSGPPTCCNAFPVTDVSGLARPADNWLFGLNCGSFGCPPNGGWANFSQLASLCRPTGDIVTRVTWSSLDCQPGTGACCLPDGSCQVLLEADCAGRGGLYRGEGASCATANCPAPSGACCLSNGNCLILSPANCTVVGGSYLGNNVACGVNNTCPLGACCLPNGTCAGSVTQAACTAQGGAFRGVGTTCVGANCPQPSGACCVGAGCLSLTAANCALIPGGSWAGAFTTCADADGNGVPDICDTAPPCPADYNQDGGVDGADIQSFFVDWSVGHSRADVNQDGGVDGSDIEYFFVRWQAGGC